MSDREHRPGYEPLTVARLGALMAGANESRRWRLVAEFLEDYRWEPPEARPALLADAPGPTGDVHWDVFLAALAKHIAARDSRLTYLPANGPGSTPGCGRGRPPTTFRTPPAPQ